MADSNSEEKPVRKPRGFAVMHPDAVRAIAKKGGIAAHAKGTAHEFTSEEARAAGRLGGLAAHRARGRAIPDAAAFELAPDEATPEHPKGA